MLKNRKFLQAILEKNSRQMKKQENGQTYGAYFIGPSLRGSNCIDLKLTSIFPFGKNLVTRFLCQKGPKMAQNEAFQVLSKDSVLNFSDILHAVKAALKLKIGFI